MTSKYDRLADHLVSLDTPMITLTFAEIEAVIGPLPAAARLPGQSWWGNTPKSRYLNAHAMCWSKADYIADRPDFAAETVSARR